MYRYQQFISDIAGQDIQAHNNEVETIVRVVRNWLRTTSGRQTIPWGNIIWERYQTFLRDLPQTVEECRLDIRYGCVKFLSLFLSEPRIIHPYPKAIGYILEIPINRHPKNYKTH